MSQTLHVATNISILFSFQLKLRQETIQSLKDIIDDGDPSIEIEIRIMNLQSEELVLRKKLARLRQELKKALKAEQKPSKRLKEQESANDDKVITSNKVLFILRSVNLF